MNLLSLKACTLFLCFATSCEAAGTSYDQLIKETEQALLKDWTDRDNVIVRLLDRVNEIEKSFGECQIRLKNASNEIKAIDKEQRDIKGGVSQRAIWVSECCSGDIGPMERTLHVNADDRITLYLDGSEIKGFEHSKDWRFADSVKLPTDTKVIAAKGANTFGDPGVLASTDDGYVLTNTSWKCSNAEEEGWKTVDFDDSQWSNAYAVLPATRKPIKGIRKDAFWIWTKNYHYMTGDRSAFCRLKLA